MHHRLWKTAAASAFTLLISASAANAATYYLQNVEFDDGTTATGFISTNVSGYIADYDIVTTTGSIAGYTFLDNINATYSPGDATITVFNNNPSYDGYLTLTAASPIDSANPSVALLTGGSSLQCASYSCPNGVSRNVVSGSLTTAPEPATWSFMLIGFAVVGGAMRRRHSARTNSVTKRYA